MLLLQGRIQGYMYNIQSDADYSERVIPPSPERSAIDERFGPGIPSSYGPFAGRHPTDLSSSVSALQVQARSLLADLALQQSRPAPDFTARWQNTAQRYFGSNSHQLQPQGGNRAVIRPSRSSARQRQEAGSGSSAAREPRPYYYRVQQQMQAGLANHAQHRCSLAHHVASCLAAYITHMYEVESSTHESYSG